MTASNSLLAQRLAAFTVAALTLVLAFSGIAIAAPAPSDCAWHQCDVVAPGVVDPDPTPPEPPVEPEPAEPAEPSEPAPTEETQPTGEPTSAPTPVEPPTAQPTSPTSTPATSVPEPVREASADNATPVHAALLAGLAATLLGGGWLATALLHRLRREE